MASSIGNIFLALAALIAFSLLYGLYGKTAPRGGDAVVGYVWGIIFTNIAFFACIALAALVIGWKGGFSWFGNSSGGRFLAVSGGVLVLALGTTVAALSREPGGPTPWLLRALAAFLPALVPVALIVLGLILVNDNLRTAVPLPTLKVSLQLVIGLCSLSVLAMAYSLLAEANQNAARRMERAREDEVANHQRHLDDIDSCDVLKNMVFILVFTDANHAPDVRERALAKIKTHPKWEQEMIRFLETDWAPEAFTFFASNDVPDKSLFADHIRNGVLNQARLIRESIRRSSHPSHLYPGQFSWEVERVLRTLDKFQGTGVDYLPAVRELRAAFDEPWEYEKPKFSCVPTLEDWIKQHKHE